MKSIFTALLLLVFSSAFAQQTVIQNKDLDMFSAVSISGKFSFRILNGPSYSVRVISDERIAEYVKPAVKNGTFSVELDEKKYPSELKKQLKAKGASAPVLEIELYAPFVKSVTLREKAVLLETDEIHVDNFELNVCGAAKVNRLSLSCVSADLHFTSSSHSNLSVRASSKLNLKIENSAVVNISQKGGNGLFNIRGSSVLNVNAEALELEIDAAGSPEIHLSGISSALSVESAGYAKIDAEALESKEGTFKQSGNSVCNANIEEHMKVNLTGGSTLTFKRKPVIEVERIISSTLIKADDPKRKQ